jgi:hypothetical protein
VSPAPYSVGCPEDVRYPSPGPSAAVVSQGEERLARAVVQARSALAKELGLALVARPPGASPGAPALVHSVGPVFQAHQKAPQSGQWVRVAGLERPETCCRVWCFARSVVPARPWTVPQVRRAAGLQEPVFGA